MPSERIPVAIRRVVAIRANNYCEYCRCPENIGTQSLGSDLKRDKSKSVQSENEVKIKP